MSKIIVLSGHGSWEMKDGYTCLPRGCSIKFYTCNMKTLSDVLGGDIDRGIVSVAPDQEGEPYSSVPNMRLYPPDGLNIRKPQGSDWSIIELPTAVSKNDKNLQVRIRYGTQGGMDLKEILKKLEPAISGYEVTILWAACRAIGLREVPGKSVGVNKMQR